MGCGTQAPASSAVAKRQVDRTGGLLKSGLKSNIVYSIDLNADRIPKFQPAAKLLCLRT
jgi:hypothetical protein